MAQDPRMVRDNQGSTMAQVLSCDGIAPVGTVSAETTTELPRGSTRTSGSRNLNNHKTTTKQQQLVDGSSSSQCGSTPAIIGPTSKCDSICIVIYLRIGLCGTCFRLTSWRSFVSMYVCVCVLAAPGILVYYYYHYYH